MSYHGDVIPNRNSPPAILFRQAQRDRKQGKQQIVFGLLCAADGCPVAVDVFAGNTADPSTVGVQVKKVQQRFGLESIALVGDRGMLTTARLRDDLELAEIRSPDFPGERLLVCLNPCLRHERAQEAINRRVGRDVSRKKVDKHFAIEVTDAEIRWSRKQDKINAEAQLAVRPIFVYSEDHVRGHILLCLLAYYVEWHLRRRLAPLLFKEEDRAGATAVAGGESAGLGEHQGQGRQQADARGAARAQLPDAAGGSGHAHAERGDAAGRPAAPVSDARQAGAAAGQGIRLARGRSGQICCQ